jgi:hypothetical protein
MESGDFYRPQRDHELAVDNPEHLTGTNVACGPQGPTTSEDWLTERWMPNKVCEVGHVGTQVTATGDPGNRNWLQQRRLARISGVVAWTGIGAWND